MSKKILTIEDFRAKKGSKIPYRDEMNFAEFPLCSLSDRISPKIKTLTFESTIYDQSIKKEVPRTLTISASDKYGLPTSLDEEVLLGLIQLSSEKGFEDRKTYFTRYELINLLGWKKNGQSYERLEQALKRWVGVTLYFDKAWWSKQYQSWGSKNFHVIEDLSLLDSDERRAQLKVEDEDPNSGKSYFCWNTTVWESFKTGYIKQLDFDFFLTLKSSISKRMFRFLDKRFGVNGSYETDLEKFAFEHIGLSRQYHLGEVKRCLNKAILELEERGFLQPLPIEERYIRQAKGIWRVRFVSTKSKALLPQEDLVAPPPSAAKVNFGIVDELASRGISRKKAINLSQRFNEKYIQDRIDLHDWLLAANDKRMKSPQGFLVSSIEKEFDISTFGDFQKTKQSPTSSSHMPFQQNPIRAEAIQPNKEEIRLEKEKEERTKYWESLSEEEKIQLEEEAVENSDGFLRKQYLDKQSEKGSLFNAAREAIIHQHIKRKLLLERAA